MSFAESYKAFVQSLISRSNTLYILSSLNRDYIYVKSLNEMHVLILGIS